MTGPGASSTGARSPCSATSGRSNPAGSAGGGASPEATPTLPLLPLGRAGHGRRPFFLGSTVRDENDQLSVALTNPDEVRDGRVVVPLGTLHLAVRALLWHGAFHWQLRARNHGPAAVTAALRLRFRSDFADIF